MVNLHSGHLISALKIITKLVAVKIQVSKRLKQTTNLLIDSSTDSILVITGIITLSGVLLLQLSSSVFVTVLVAMLFGTVNMVLSLDCGRDSWSDGSEHSFGCNYT